MTEAILLAVTVSAALCGLAVLCVVATREHPVMAQAATVNPFAPAVGVDAAADTIAHGGAAHPTLAGDWQEVVLRDLSEVEDLLDNLEAIGVRHRELVTAGNDTFTVRWR